MGIDTSNRRNYNLQTTRCRPLSAMPPVTPLTSYYPHAGRLASAGFGADASPSKTYVTASKRSVYTAGSTKPRSTATTKPWQNATKNCYSKSNFCPLFSITPQPQQHYNQQKIVESFQTDMKDVPQWLKSLRLHKYTALFQTMSYAEMMALDEAQLERRDVTQGARRKIMQSIKRLHDRPRALFELNTRMHSDANVETVCDAINELCVILNTPIPAVSTATASSLPVYILRVLDQIHNLLFKSTMAENTRSQRNILPEIEDEYVVRLMQICEKILAHEAFEINAKQQIASYRSTLRRYIQNYGIRSNIVQNSFEYKTSAPRSSRHYHKSALSHPHSSCCKRTVALCDTTATSELTNSKVDSYRRVNSEIAACAQIPLFDDCTQSTNSVNTITNDGNFESRRSCVAGDDVQRSLGMLNETQKANLCNWMLLLRDYPAKQPSVTEPDTVSTNQLIVNLIQSTIQSEVVAEQPAIESVDVEPSTAYFSGVTASRIAPKRCCAPVTPFNTISKEFDAWLPFSEDTIPSSNNDAAQFRSDFYEQPAIISQNIPTNTAPTSTSTTLIGYADRFFSFSYSSSSDPSSSDRSSGAGSPMVYNFFEDELPPTDLIDKRPSPRISTALRVPRNALAVCSGYGSADDAFDNHNAYEQQQQNMFSMLLLRQMQQQQVQQQQYKLFS